MTPQSSDDTGVLTRRALRRDRTGAGEAETTPSGSEGTSEPGDAGAADSTGPADDTITDHQGTDDTGTDDTAVVAQWVDEGDIVPALTWVDAAAVAAGSTAGAERADRVGPQDDLLTGLRRRPRAGAIIPLVTIAALAASYCGGALLAPLDAVAPEISAVEVTPVASQPATLSWPAEGSAAVAVSGAGAAASTGDASLMASITKVVSVMMVLEKMPLAPGESGPSFEFARSDSRDYWRYIRDNQSALDVPVGGSLTQYQMLQGILLGSANNYIDRLAEEIWGSDREFADAARTWLEARGLEDITVVTPAGRDERNVATPQALARLADIAMANPVFAEIVGTRTAEIPGAGAVRNSNGLLADPGFVGVKTGTLDGQYNLLSAKDVDVAGRTVRLYAAVLGQPDNATRLAVSRTLYSEVEAALQAQGPAVDAGTLVGEISTVWGESVDVVTDADARVVLWNGAAASAEVLFDLDDERTDGEEVGTLTVTGPLDSLEIPVSLDEDLEGPTAWWRLTHPIELFGLAG